MTFRILVVCTGNICRSPAAAQLLDAAVESDVDVSSAGTDALVGLSLDPAMADAMRRAGAAPRPHRARRLNSWLLEVADLVLTMDQVQRRRVLELAPEALHRTFTLREFALICQSLLQAGDSSWPARSSQESRFRSLTERAGRRHGLLRPGPDVVIEDPYRGPAAGYDRAMNQIGAAVRLILEALHTTRAPRPVLLRPSTPRRLLPDGPAEILNWPPPIGRAPRRSGEPPSPN
ncbi:low molecular weight phosphatase family protein [Acidipropionibacterium virtanenii]|uniref:Low molecular weight protein-tyrosine-phosphatase Ptp n=1 Tax=Acidipropionibacterium virtanenii TaxID=2057246 RepID=A0A344UX69_9ACTN|nr:low molecular weight phosphatase family protein [Acidipropionibacterium virtanenii]AXE39867.1 Low molecular weight protein-tyrosine-phosphatase Ptp [Acidipropionibacterium virtanenii]